jgi:hypothetical protein
MALISRSKHYLTRSVRILLYKSLVVCHLDYCNILWGSAAPTLLTQIKSFQKKAVRLAYGAKYNAHTSPLFEKIYSLRFEDLVHHNLAKMGSRIIKRRVPPGVATAFNIILPEITILRVVCYLCILPTGSLRRNVTHSLQVPTCRTGSLHRMTQYTIPHLYNSLPAFYKEGDTSLLEIMFKCNIMDKYRSFACTATKCYSCSSRPTT